MLVSIAKYTSSYFPSLYIRRNDQNRRVVKLANINIILKKSICGARFVSCEVPGLSLGRKVYFLNDIK